MIDLNQSTSIVRFRVDGLDTPTEKQRLLNVISKQAPTIDVLKNPTLNKKTQIHSKEKGRKRHTVLLLIQRKVGWLHENRSIFQSKEYHQR